MDVEKPQLCMVSDANQFWLHYLSLEKALKDISEYIAISKDNYEVYSFKNMQLYFAVCSEIDSIFKHIRRNISDYTDEGSDKRLTIAEHKAMIEKYFNAIKETEVELNISGFNLQFQPFRTLFDCHEKTKERKAAAKKAGKEYDINNYEGWWNDYNSVKHRRLESFHKANLNNLLNSFSALHILNLVYAISLETQWIENYDSILIEAPATYHYPIFQIKNSGASRYTGGGHDYYRSNLSNKSIYPAY